MVSEKYSFIVIGGGASGLTASRFASQLGKKVLLIEKDRIGGDCTWTGCVPSKTLIRTANLAHEMRTADHFGLPPGNLDLDFKKVMKHVEEVIQEVYEEETPERLKEQGIDVAFGVPSFNGPNIISIEEEEIVGEKILICTGARPLIPPIEGLADVEYWTNETIFSLQELPKRLVVIGGGPIGCELSQAFNRLGSKVTLLTNVPRLLPRDEPEAAEVLQKVFEEEGIELHFNSEINKVSQDKRGFHVQNGNDEIIGDELLIAAGRRPNIEGLNLEKAGVEFAKNGIIVDNKLRTSQKHIYASGDCVSGNLQFTHYAGWQGWIATRNALMPGSAEGRTDIVPWTTFTSPEIAHVGDLEHEALDKDTKSRSAICPISMVDRAKTDRNLDGFLKVILKSDGTIIGATIVSARAGESIQEWIMAIRQGLGIEDIASTLHVYPTYISGSMDMAANISMESFLSSAKGKIVRFFT
ncbi:MAG: dihydrolipoyl dehydrogenase family protein [Candidatus Heimdallarchaeota archaeon]